MKVNSPELAVYVNRLSKWQKLKRAIWTFLWIVFAPWTVVGGNPALEIKKRVL